MGRCRSKYKCDKNAGWGRRICKECRERVDAELLTEIHKTKPLYHKHIKAIISFTTYGLLGIGCSTLTKLEKGWVKDESEKTVYVQFEPWFEHIIYRDILKSDIIEITDD